MTSTYLSSVLKPKCIFKQFAEAGKRVGKPVVEIPFPAYIPIPMGIEKMAKLVLDNMPG